jgi:hypothetical protein
MSLVYSFMIHIRPGHLLGDGDGDGDQDDEATRSGVHCQFAHSWEEHTGSSWHAASSYKNAILNSELTFPISSVRAGPACNLFTAPSGKLGYAPLRG